MWLTMFMVWGQWQKTYTFHFWDNADDLMFLPGFQELYHLGLRSFFSLSQAVLESKQAHAGPYQAPEKLCSGTIPVKVQQWQIREFVT
jgi:hypothetical protein